jgi:hypothetical protein
VVERCEHPSTESEGPDPKLAEPRPQSRVRHYIQPGERLGSVELHSLGVDFEQARAVGVGLVVRARASVPRREALLGARLRLLPGGALPGDAARAHPAASSAPVRQWGCLGAALGGCRCLGRTLRRCSVAAARNSCAPSRRAARLLAPSFAINWQFYGMNGQPGSARLVL